MARGADGLLRARLLDLVPGRSGTVYRTWLEEQTDAFRAGVRRAAALDPFRWVSGWRWLTGCPPGGSSAAL